MKTKIYYDFEATSVSRDADIVSVGLVAVTGKEIKTFYAEFTDFSIGKCDDWVKENIVSKLQFSYFDGQEDLYNITSRTSDNPKGNDIYKGYNKIMQGNTLQIGTELKQWLSQFQSIEFWADFDVIDKPMLIDLISNWDVQHIKHKTIYKDEHVGFGYSEHNVGLPRHLPNIKYDHFFDLHTYLKIKGVETDINRVEFIKDLIKEIPEGQSHNALYDSFVNWKLHEKLSKL